ncbi:MAG: hypothetical protein M1839_005865 [Geoglossum umbratile]|nr:MAG: hypothetical protein M1839_005865 [Geoglossum umbratile]
MATSPSGKGKGADSSNGKEAGSSKGKETAGIALVQFRNSLKKRLPSLNSILEPGRKGPRIKVVTENYDRDSIETRRLIGALYRNSTVFTDISTNFRRMKSSYNNLQGRLTKVEATLGEYDRAFKEMGTMLESLEGMINDLANEYEDYASNYGPGVKVSWRPGGFAQVTTTDGPSRLPSASPSPPLSPTALPTTAGDESDCDTELWLPEAQSPPPTTQHILSDQPVLPRAVPLSRVLQSSPPTPEAPPTSPFGPPLTWS